MNVQELHKRLMDNGILAQVQPGFRGMLPGVESNDRIVCAQDENGLYGPSFWLYGNGPVWYVGFWSGDAYSVSSLDSMVQFAAEFISDPRRSIALPDDLAKKYGFTIVRD